MSTHSQINQGQRRKNDDYFTPISMIDQLYEIADQYNLLDYNKKVLEPACGEGHMVRKLQERFKNIIWSDKNYTYNNSKKVDFILNSFVYDLENVDYIITNPPFSLFSDFVITSKMVALEKIIFLGKLDFLTGLKRYNNIYSNNNCYNLKYVWIFVRKPDLRYKIRDDGMYPCAIDGYGWFIWENGYEGKPMFDWINNQRYIIGNSKMENRD